MYWQENVVGFTVCFASHLRLNLRTVSCCDASRHPVLYAFCLRLYILPKVISASDYPNRRSRTPTRASHLDRRLGGLTSSITNSQTLLKPSLSRHGFFPHSSSFRSMAPRLPPHVETVIIGGCFWPETRPDIFATRSSPKLTWKSRWRSILAHSILHFAWPRPLLCWPSSRCHTAPKTHAPTQFAASEPGPVRSLLFEFEIQYTSPTCEHFAGHSHPAQRRHSNRVPDMHRMAKGAGKSYQPCRPN